MAAIFITATGTDIGKTFVTSGLVRTVRAAGANATAIKPVVSGLTQANLAQSDTGVLLDAMGDSVTSNSLDRVSPWRFAAPLSPDMAAAREGRVIDFDELVDFCRDAIAQNTGTLFIEGVGGVMVPLDARHTVLDWMSALDIPILLVTGSYLGTISHTLTALDVVRRAGLAVRAVVLNESDESTVPLDETRATLERFVDVPILALPRVKSWLDARKPLAALAGLLE